MTVTLIDEVTGQGFDAEPMRCPGCSVVAVVPLTPAQLAKQPDFTTHVCHPSLDGCNRGFQVTQVRTPKEFAEEAAERAEAMGLLAGGGYGAETRRRVRERFAHWLCAVVTEAQEQKDAEWKAAMRKHWGIW